MSPQEVDPFDLPEWLGTAEVTWAALTGVRSGHLVTGVLRAAGEDDLACDLLAVDEAYPAPVVEDPVRLQAHRAWRHGQLALLRLEGRLTLAVPGAELDASRVLATIGRLARAVGADPERYAALLRLGDG